MAAPLKSLIRQGNPLADSSYQLEQLAGLQLPAFHQKLKEGGSAGLHAGKINILQVNLGKVCNQTCLHCHVDAGPDRREDMSRQTAEECLRALAQSDIPALDITGGAPELNDSFRYLVEGARALGRHVMVRCNLTVILSNKKYADLPHWFAQNKVEVICSLPHYTAGKTDRQRGEKVFDHSVKALKMLNDAGYADPETGLVLNLVYNPAGAFLPPSQAGLEADFRRELSRQFGIRFNNLFVITNMPISRFLQFLMQSGNYQGYMEKLVNAYNPAAAENVMCISTLSVGWDGYLYDCDFNQMLDLNIGGSQKAHISQFSQQNLEGRPIITARHCFGCTAGAGSSCGGAVA